MASTNLQDTLPVIGAPNSLPESGEGWGGVAICCPPILTEAISEEDATTAARIFKALSEPARVRLLSAIAAGGDEGVCVCELVEPLELSQPTVSHHLKLLYEAGLVTRERRGTWIYYSLRQDAMEPSRARPSLLTPKQIASTGSRGEDTSATGVIDELST